MSLEVTIQPASSPASHVVTVEFPSRLQHAKDSYSLYTSECYRKQEGETGLLSMILETLLNGDNSGIERICVGTYTMEIRRSLNVSREDIKNRLFAAIRNCGITPVEV